MIGLSQGPDIGGLDPQASSELAKFRQDGLKMGGGLGTFYGNFYKQEGFAEFLAFIDSNILHINK